MNTMQHMNAYEVAGQNLGLSISDLISSGVYKLVVAIERSIRAI
ncbi:hypothetical protein L2D14_04160 [Thalassospiraceae bacterium LMO-JJ14]|nr:hypothetical protein L2D14_04160 [Thalassospiraceae bacterium LMO-JJ14]